MRAMRVMRFALFLLLSIPFFGLVGCNTVSGFGEDLETAGSEIEQTAEEEQRD